MGTGGQAEERVPYGEGQNPEGRGDNLHARHRHDKRQPPSSSNIIQVCPKHAYTYRLADLNVCNGTSLSDKERRGLAEK